MGKRRSRKITPWLNDTVALRMLKQVLPEQLVQDIKDTLSVNEDVFISRTSGVCEDFTWQVQKVQQPRDIIQYIDAFPCADFKLYIRRIQIKELPPLSYSFYIRVHLNFKEKARILGVLIPIYKNCKNPEDKAKLRAEIRRIKYGGVVLRTNLSEVRDAQASDSSDT